MGSIKIRSERKPSTIGRCYLTGRTDVDKVCHHCGNLMSSLIAPFPTYHRWDKILFESNEYNDVLIDLPVPVKHGIHCQNCSHDQLSWLWLFIFPVTLFITILYQFIVLKADFLGSWRFEFFVLVLIIQLFIIFLGGFLSLSFYKDRLKNQPKFPVLGQRPKFVVSETMLGNIEIDETGKYSSKALGVGGKLEFSTRITPQDYERAKRYGKHFHKRPDEYLGSHFGFVLLTGLPNLFIKEKNVEVKTQDNLIELIDSGVVQYFPRNVGVQNFVRTWECTVEYSFDSLFNISNTFPIQLIPAIVDEGEHEALEIVIQTSSEFRQRFGSQNEIIIEEFKLYYPYVLGAVKNASPSAISGSDKQSTSHIDHWVKWIYVAQQNAGIEQFYVRFENSLERSSVFKALLTIRINEALSGISDIRYYYPFGALYENKDLSCKIFSQIRTSAKFTLNSLLVRKKIEVEDSFTIKVVPNHILVTQIVDGLSNLGVYVQRVIENPPTTDRIHARVVNRFWDIAGRYYFEGRIYPIDFHLILIGRELLGSVDEPQSIGRELLEDIDRPKSGDTKIEITVQSTVFQNEMKQVIQKFCKELVENIKYTITCVVNELD